LISKRSIDALKAIPPILSPMPCGVLIVNGNHLKEAQQHFAAAVKSGRERPIVRELQIAAIIGLRGRREDQLIRVCNEMRKK
jgi:hypothetical protein